MLEGIQWVDEIIYGYQMTSFVSNPPYAPREIELIRAWENNPNEQEDNSNGESRNVIDWTNIGSSLINEYNTEGLFYMAFPTLFSKGQKDWLHTRIHNVHLHEYEKHFLRYCDKFGRHPRFRYFLLNFIMRHRAQVSSTLFVKKI